MTNFCRDPRPPPANECHNQATTTRQIQTRDTEIRERIIYIQNPSYPRSDDGGGEETFTMVPRDEDVVQFRIDFIEFEVMSVLEITVVNETSKNCNWRTAYLKI